MREDKIFQEQLEPEQIPDEEFMDVAPQAGDLDSEEALKETRNDKFASNQTKPTPFSTGKKERRQILTLSTKDELLAIIQNEIPYLKKSLASLRDDPKAHAQVLSTLAKFLAPTLQSVSAEVSGGTKLTIEGRLNRLIKPTEELLGQFEDIDDDE